jgi:glycosyltransferase involved in cell wall biosynthesis
MTPAPDVSVVMSVFNGGEQLPETLDSVLAQEGCDYEFIVIDDGSTDDTPRLLNDCSRKNERLRVINQGNTGLTRALIRGCAEARGRYIARQDAGDISLPGRLAGQCSFLDSHPNAVMTACAMRLAGPGREPLQTVSKPMLTLDTGIRQLSLQAIRGPHHGSTMFRTQVYRQVGGYRLPFVVAQDIDLWLRMSEYGQCIGMPELLYEARMQAGSISSRRRDEQFRLGSLAIDCAKLRRQGEDESKLLQSYVPSPLRKGPVGRREMADFHYFIASCLRQHDPGAAKRYYRQALRDNPFHLKALLRCITG